MLCFNDINTYAAMGHTLTFYRLLLTSFFLLLPYISQADQQLTGEQLYLENCAICHGEKGDGGMGIPLSLQSFLDSASEDYLHKSIRLGRPGRIMPSFYWMSETDIDRIIQHIAKWRKSPPPIWSEISFDGDIQKGKQLYLKHCASCHGSNAEGGKGSGLRFSRHRDMPITAPALSNQGFLYSVPDQMLQHIIINGRKGTPMPDAQSLGLDKHDVQHLVSFIRSLQQPHLSHQPVYDTEPPTLVVESSYSFEETIDNIKRSLSGSNFVHIRDQLLLEGFTTTRKANSRQMIIYFCSFSFLYEALKLDPRVGMFLPCRVTVTETDGKVQMMSINPKHLSQLFNNSELDKSCDQMYELYTQILEDASL